MPVTPTGVRRITIGASIRRAPALRVTTSLRVGASACIGFRSSVFTNAGAAAPLSPREGAVISPRGGAGAFSASRETTTRPLVNRLASIPLTPPGAR